MGVPPREPVLITPASVPQRPGTNITLSVHPARADASTMGWRHSVLGIQQMPTLPAMGAGVRGWHQRSSAFALKKKKKYLREKAVGSEGTKPSHIRLLDLRAMAARPWGQGPQREGAGGGAAVAQQEHVGGTRRTGLRVRAATPDACKQLLSSSPVSIRRLSPPGAPAQVGTRGPVSSRGEGRALRSQG